MITVIPADAMIEALHAFGISPSREGDWWIVYHWFCEQFSAWKHRGDNYAILCGDGKCGCIQNEYDAIRDRQEPIRRLAYLFARLMPGWIDRESRGKPRFDIAARFLTRCGIRTWQGLVKPMRFHGWHPKVFPKSKWFEMQGRTFKTSPNSCHPKATSVFGFTFELCERKGWLQWVGRIEYGYPHDGSSWYVGIPQIRDETLDKFAVRIDETIDGLLVPESWSCGREQYERDWNRTRRAIDDVFNVSDCRLDYDGLTNLFMDVKGSSLQSHRVRLDNRRAALLRRWLRADAVKLKKE